MENTVKKLEKQSNIIELKLLNGKLVEKNTKYNKDGSEKIIVHNRKDGVSSEVYGFKTKEEIKRMIDVLDSRIELAPDEEKKKIAYRNKMLFLIGINLGIRASDLRELKWNFFFENNGEWKEFYKIQPKKTRKYNKYVTLYFNNVVKKTINDYIEMYPIQDYNDYLFASRKGEKPIAVSSLWKIIKAVASDAGIKKNIGSHSLRKTWGYWCFNNATDKNKALVVLQQCFNHSSTSVTLKYIGLCDEDISDMYNSIDLGMEFI